ncbi:hypothetical protein JCM5353_002493 [Sporobolomyces roseus]
MSDLTAEQLTISTSADNANRASDESPRSPPSGRLPSLTTGKLRVKVGVLFDAGMDCFNHVYTVRDQQGGRAAARDLQQSVKEVIRKDKLDNIAANDVEIGVFVSSFLNVQGLADYTGDDIRSFAQGFNSSSFASAMSDVGEDSNVVITAMKNHLPFLVSTCDYVIFGGSHSNKCHKSLHELRDDGLLDKVILLRTSSTCANKISRLALSEARFPHLLHGRSSTSTEPELIAPLQAASTAESFREVSEDEDDNEAEVVNAQEVPEDFVDLIDVLRSQFGGFATFSKASYLITRRGSKIWGEGNRYLSFNKYVREAYRAGLVESGQMPGQKHNPKAQWVKLLQPYRSNTSSCLSASTHDLIPSEFVPLLNAFAQEGMTTSTRHNLADRVLANGDRTLWDEADWQDYLEKAERLGIVQRSRSGKHDSSWSMITLRRSL